MAVRVITAPPGKGKTLNMTNIALKDFKSENSIFDKIYSFLHKKEFIYYNNIYSNYPILLYYQKKPFKVKLPGGEIINAIPIKKTYDPKLQQSYYCKCEENVKEYYGIFSNYVRFTDMHLAYDFGENVSFYIDEIQYIYDSNDYKDFPDCIAHFFQAHRHLGVKYIYTNSQSLSRVIKRVLCVSEEYWNILKVIKIFNILIVKFIVRYDISSGKNEENIRVLDEEKINWDIFTTNKVYNGYITRYLNALKENLPKYPNRVYTSLKMPKNAIIKGFLVSKQEKDKLQKEIF